MAVRCRLIGGSFGWSFGGLRSTGILSFSERLKCVRTARQACRRHAPTWRCFPSPFLSEFCAKTHLVPDRALTPSGSRGRREHGSLGHGAIGGKQYRSAPNFPEPDLEIVSDRQHRGFDFVEVLSPNLC